MEALTREPVKDMCVQSEPQAGLPGLITETDFDRPELYGFEVDLAGEVRTQEFRPTVIKVR